jgi:hypothetical protein
MAVKAMPSCHYQPRHTQEHSAGQGHWQATCGNAKDAHVGLVEAAAFYETPCDPRESPARIFFSRLFNYFSRSGGGAQTGESLWSWGVCSWILGGEPHDYQPPSFMNQCSDNAIFVVPFRELSSP